MGRIRLARAAQRDLDEVTDYLRAHSLTEAARVGATITTKIELLARFPEIGPLVEQRGPEQYRRTVAGEYVIWYRVDANTDVLVVGIRHGRRRAFSLQELDLRNRPD